MPFEAVLHSSVVLNVVVVVVLGVGVFCSVRERCRRKRWRSLPHARPSPLSQALAQLVGTAGGIYLSCELLLGFLGVPAEWWAGPDLAVKPLAAFSLIIAIFQPYALRLWRTLHQSHDL